MKPLDLSCLCVVAVSHQRSFCLQHHSDCEGLSFCKWQGILEYNNNLQDVSQKQQKAQQATLEQQQELAELSAQVLQIN